MVRKQNWLSVLEVSSAGHSNTKVFFRLSAKCVNVREQLFTQRLRGVFHERSDQGCNLVIARATSSNLAGYFRSGNLDQTALKRGVDIFLFRLWLKCA